MAFNTSPGRAEYTATAAQTIFTFTFKIFDTSDIKVYLTPSGQTADDTADLLTETTDYTVTINGDNGGDVTLVSGAALNDSITLVRTLPTTRTTEYQQNGDLTAGALNEDQDYQTYLILDGALANNRAMSLQESTQGVSTDMPSPVPLAFFQWNAAGTAIQNQTSFYSEGVLWTASDVYLKTETYSQAEVDAMAKLWDSQTTTHNMASDAAYTLTEEQNKFGRIVITDTGVVLTATRNILVDTKEKSFIFQNDTAQNLNAKVVGGGATVKVTPGSFATLYADGTDVLDISSGAKIEDGSSIHSNGVLKYKVLQIDMVGAATGGTVAHGISNAWADWRILDVSGTALVVGDRLFGTTETDLTYSFTKWEATDTYLSIYRGTGGTDETYQCLITYV